MADAARTAAACRIARLDRQRFNDLMASGEYSCAPSTTPGVPRVFEMPDLIGLFLFTRLTERQRTVKQASEIACRIVDQVRDAVNNGRELPQFVGIGHDMPGASFCGPGDNLDPKATHMVHGTPMLWTEMWNIANIAAEVRAGLANEGRIVGED